VAAVAVVLEGKYPTLEFITPPPEPPALPRGTAATS